MPRFTRGFARSFQPRLESLEDRLVPTSLPSGFQESLVAGQLGAPTAMALAPDGRVFITLQDGDLRVVKNGTLLGTPFLHLNVDSSGERGLLGVAFDPGFASNHYVYVYYTVPGSGVHNRVSRFTASTSNPDVAAAGSEQDLLDLTPLSGATNHNGGAIHFGGDGMLYVDAGENANPANSQTLGNLLGKVLRLDVGNVAPTDPANSPKLIPPDNPFVGQATGINQVIYALGFRNPFTFAVQPGTGTIFINDVGASTWEEIDRLVAGGNYGWNLSEGFASTVPPPGLGPGTYQDPQLAYNHSGGPAGGGIAIVGGVFYNPPAGATHPFPASYTGKYFYEDLGGDWIRVFDPAHPGSLANPDTSSGFATGTVNNPVDLLVAPDGGLYYLARGNGGELLEISSTAAVAPSISVQPHSQTTFAGQSASFTVTAGGTAPLHYQWQRNSGTGRAFVNISGATSAALALSNVQTSDSGAQFRVVVSNSAGSATSSAATLTVTARPFVAHINFTSRAGQTVPGYVNDVGLAYGSRGSLTFGWDRDNTLNAYDRDAANSPDELHDSFSLMLGDSWQIAVPSGAYQVHVLAGDPSSTSGTYLLDVEGVQVVKGTPTAARHWLEGTAVVLVRDGKLTLTSGMGAANNKIDAIDIQQVAVPSGYSGNFAGATGLTLNGSAKVRGTRLELTDGRAHEAGSAFLSHRVGVGRFTTAFDFRLTGPAAEGFTFVLQGGSPKSLGRAGSALAYGPTYLGGSGGIDRSVAVKFDLASNRGEGSDSVGVFLNGHSPTTGGLVPSGGPNDLTGSGIDLHSGHVFRASLTYDGGTLTLTLTDRQTGARVTRRYRVDAVGLMGTTGYVGFTGSTGTQTATQDILDWSYTPQS